MSEKASFVSAFEHREELIPLYEEYSEVLLRANPGFGASLAQQNYGEEIAHLEDKYQPPCGCMYLIYYDGALAGCVGMKPLDEESAELKRLYLRPSFRGHNLGEQMLVRIMEDARTAGYKRLRLDTLPALRTALALYRRIGFYEIDPYYDCLIPGTIFMEIELLQGRSYETAGNRGTDENEPA